MRRREWKGKVLPLANSGGLEIFFIGVGSAFSKLHNQTNLLVIKGGTHLLIDCGTKTPQALFKLGRPVTDLSNVLITHSHADHIGGLEEVLLMFRYAARKKFNLIVTKDYKDILWKHSLMGGSGFNENHEGKHLELEDFCDILYPREIPSFPRQGFETDLGSLNVKMFRTKHIPDNALSWEDSFYSYGLILDNKVLFSCDTRYDPDMILSLDRIFRFQAIFHDCQFFPGGVHASIQELTQLPSEIKERMFLVHYGDNWKKFNPEKTGFAGFTKEKTFYSFR